MKDCVQDNLSGGYDRTWLTESVDLVGHIGGISLSKWSSRRARCTKGGSVSGAWETVLVNLTNKRQCTWGRASAPGQLSSNLTAVVFWTSSTNWYLSITNNPYEKSNLRTWSSVGQTNTCRNDWRCGWLVTGRTLRYEMLLVKFGYCRRKSHRAMTNANRLKSDDC